MVSDPMWGHLIKIIIIMGSQEKPLSPKETLGSKNRVMSVTSNISSCGCNKQNGFCFLPTVALSSERFKIKNEDK
jgi:hypothetical protein